MRIQQYMREHSLSNVAMGALIGVSTEAVRLWVHGKREISPLAAIKISKATGIPLHEIRADIWAAPPRAAKRRQAGAAAKRAAD